jgi:ribonuclease III
MPQSPLESRLRYEFRNAELLRQALTHRSHSATHNERLEFLGDSVLNCAVAALLFQRFGKLDEGDLSRVRANLVKQQSLYEIAQALNIADGLRLGEGELRSGGFRRPSILADALEAIFGAIFLDSGFDAAQTVIKRLYVPILDHIDPRTLGKDAKTLLQEYLQGHKIALPTYTVIATHGAAHNQQFEVECTVPKLDVKVSGSGASRRAAEQAAAKKALDEVMAAAPAVVAKPRRSKGARAAKAEPEVVPGVTGVQGALDLRSPDRRERPARGERPGALAEAVGVAGVAGVADSVPLPQQGAPLAVIRAAHVQERPAEKVEGAASRSPSGEKPGERAAGRAEHAADKSADKIATPERGATSGHTSHRAPAVKADAALRAAERTETRTETRVEPATQTVEPHPAARGRDTGETPSAGNPAESAAGTGSTAALPVRAADTSH